MLTRKDRITPRTKETRFLNNGELRIKADPTGKKIVGYAAKFAPARSEDLGGWVEEIDLHAFDNTLAAKVDCRALWNHDPNHVLGRTAAGTLRLSIDGTGLFYEIDPPDTTIAKDLMVSMERGDVTQSSFGFICLRDRWQEIGGQVVRTVLEAQLLDISPVTYPAYIDATSGLRASLRGCPANLRRKLTRADDLDDDDETDLDCDGVDADDPGCEDRCQCRCSECRDGQCEQCSDAQCADDNCEACPSQIRAAHIALLTRRLR